MSKKEREDPALLSALAFIEERMTQWPHQEAVAECDRCNVGYIAAWARKQLAPSPAPPPTPEQPSGRLLRAMDEFTLAVNEYREATDLTMPVNKAAAWYRVVNARDDLIAAACALAVTPEPEQEAESSDAVRCPRCNSERIRRIQELFGAGWRDYCDTCQNIFTRAAPVYTNASAPVSPAPQENDKALTRSDQSGRSTADLRDGEGARIEAKAPSKGPQAPSAYPHAPVWLIEAKSGRSPTYFSGRCGKPTTTLAFESDVNWAVRFARFEDAEQVRLWGLDPSVGQMCGSVQHLWMIGSAADSTAERVDTTGRSAAPSSPAPDGTTRQRVIKAGWEGFSSSGDEHSVNGYVAAAREALLIIEDTVEEFYTDAMTEDNDFARERESSYANILEAIRELLADLSAPSDDEKVTAS